MTVKAYDSIQRSGIAPFNYFHTSDHRGIYVDIDFTAILDNEEYVIPAAHL